MFGAIATVLLWGRGGFDVASGTSSKLPDLDQWIDAMAPVVRLDIAPEQRPGVKSNLKTAAKMAALLDKAVMEAEIEPAPVYRA